MFARFVSALLLLPVLLLLPRAASAQLKSPCGSVDRAQLEAVLSTGGTLAFGCSGSIEIDETLVADGVQATVVGPGVTILRGALVPPIRLLEIHGGAVTFDGVNFQNGYALGVDGLGGEDCAGGLPGMDGGEGQHGTAGDPGGGAIANAGAGAGALTIQDCFFENNAVQGSMAAHGHFGGAGGGGGNGAIGGSKGLGGENWLSAGFAPDGMVGVDGSSGTDGMEGVIGFAVAPDCLADGELCTVPEAGAGTVGVAAIATCLGLQRRPPRPR